ncbi:Lpg1974 family pore-forming outer membrane protein [Planctomicrobium sp. SH661]|uniref:Lpg1974 family pore-forming outer membrane protein n=1 Tax=Planctomicrobium sp. SH661 TaxID=3448124 RepID=UPI003F5B2064
MRSLGLLLTLLLFPVQQLCASELFGEFLYWKMTQPVDWVLDTNRLPVDQFVAYRSLEYDFQPGLRVGITHESELDARLTYTHYQTETSDSATGSLTGAFLGSKFAQPPAPVFYFDAGQIEASLNYNMFDADLGKKFRPTDSLMLRPTVGLRGGWIDQSIRSSFQAEYKFLGLHFDQDLQENMRNDFWGIGPKVGIESVLNLWKREQCHFNLIANFSAAYLVGHWSISDVTNYLTTIDGLPTTSQRTVDVPKRDFGAVAFQAVVGLNFESPRWSGTFGYELNDWLNQCQIMDDATGPHNNDLLLQGLTARLAFRW